MGIFINPGNQGFKEIKTDNYIDKTSLIACINDTIETERRLTCISRPRRFGKSYAAQMLASYYCTGCDSAPLFDGLEISKDESYTRYMNKYNVLYLDITYFLCYTFKCEKEIGFGFHFSSSSGRRRNVRIFFLFIVI